MEEIRLQKYLAEARNSIKKKSRRPNKQWANICKRKNSNRVRRKNKSK